MTKQTKLLIALFISFAAAAVGSWATNPNIATWYAQLDKPFFTPPNWLFGPVWTLLYILMAFSLYLVWTQRPSKGKSLKKYEASKRSAYGWYGLQIVLNVLWSLTFFGLQQTWLGVVAILTLWLSIFMTMQEFGRFSKLAQQLLIPYILWVSFATCLNVGLALLN